MIPWRVGRSSIRECSWCHAAFAGAMVALEYGSTFGRRSLRKQCTTQTFPKMRDYKGTRGYSVAYREELQRESPTQGGQSFPNSSAVGIRECWCPYVPESILRWPTETKKHNLEAIFCSVSLSLSRTKKVDLKVVFLLTCREIAHREDRLTSAWNPMRWISMLSPFFGFPFSGKCIMIGAELKPICWNTCQSTEAIT